jgi:hypothetical protein
MIRLFDKSTEGEEAFKAKIRCNYPGAKVYILFNPCCARVGISV